MPARSAVINCTTTPKRAYDAEHGDDVVEKRGWTDERERADRPLRRQRAQQRREADDRERRDPRDRGRLAIVTATPRPAEDGDQRERDQAPAQADLVLEQSFPHARRDPDPPRRLAEQRVFDRGNQVAPPLRAIAKELRARDAERGRMRHDRAGRVRRIDDGRRRDCEKTAGGDGEMARGPRTPAAGAQPVRRHGDGRHDRGDQSAVEVRERDGRRGGAKKQHCRRRRLVEAAPEREQVQRYPLCLRDVRMIGRLRQVKGSKGVGERGHGGAGRRQAEIAGEEEGGDRRQGKGEQHEPVVGRHRPEDPGEQRAGNVGDRLRVDARGDRPVELAHDGEGIVMAPGDLHAEHPFRRRAHDRRGDEQGEDRGDRADRGGFSGAREQISPPGRR